MAMKSKEKRTRRIARIIAAIWIILIAVMVILGTAKADEDVTEVWVLCQPDSFVNVRRFPSKSSDVIGWIELGDMAWTDGQKRNGFLHIYGTFECDGWIHAGFISRTPVIATETAAEVRSNGRVACRRYINGTRRKWLKNGFKVDVYAFSDEWSITSEGFIQTKYLAWEENNDV